MENIPIKTTIILQLYKIELELIFFLCAFDENSITACQKQLLLDIYHNSFCELSSNWTNIAPGF